jgi:hypothetical protein
MRTSLAGFIVAFTVLQCSLIPHEASADPPTPAGSSPAAQLASVDQFFVTSYGQAVHEVLGLPGSPPTFLVLPDRLVLYQRGVRQEWPLLAPVFDEMKTVAHVTLGLFAILSPTNGGPLAAGDVTALRRYQGLIATARSAIAQATLTETQRARQQQILDASDALAVRALASGHLSESDLTTFCRAMRPLVDANVGEAVRAYLDELNLRMGAALPVLDPAQRAEYLVIVSGVHQARIDNAAMQYFNRLMGDPAVISQRLMYAENVFDEAGALHLLGIHLMARRVGSAYFDDRDYMNRDLFAPAAAAYIPTMQLPGEGREGVPR